MASYGHFVSAEQEQQGAERETEELAIYFAVGKWRWNPGQTLLQQEGKVWVRERIAPSHWA